MTLANPVMSTESKTAVFDDTTLACLLAETLLPIMNREAYH